MVLPPSLQRSDALSETRSGLAQPQHRAAYGPLPDMTPRPVPEMSRLRVESHRLLLFVSLVAIPPIFGAQLESGGVLTPNAAPLHHRTEGCLPHHARYNGHLLSAVDCEARVRTTYVVVRTCQPSTAARQVGSSRRRRPGRLCCALKGQPSHARRGSVWSSRPDLPPIHHVGFNGFHGPSSAFLTARRIDSQSPACILRSIRDLAGSR